jgi:hypothetical protein
MKDQYFADERDCLKYDLWMELADHLTKPKRLPFVPMLTAPDGTEQGGKTKYVVGERRECLYSFLRRCIGDGRRAITELRQFFASEIGRCYAYQPYRDGDTQRNGFFEDKGRKEYFDSIPPESLCNSVVLIDPDTGLETNGSYWRRRRERYVKYEDIVSVAKRTIGNSVLAIVQFPQRNSNLAKNDMDFRAGRLYQVLVCSGMDGWSVYWIAQKKPKTDTVGDLAFFVLVRDPGPAKKVKNILRNYAKRHSMALHDFH